MHTTSSGPAVTSHSWITRAHSAADFVLKHAESFGTSIEGLGYDGQYEVLVGFAELNQRVIILLSDDLPRTARKTAQKLRWITTHFQCTIYAPSRVLHLNGKSWAQYYEPSTEKPSPLRKLKLLRHRSSPSVTDPEQPPREDLEASDTERSGASASTAEGTANSSRSSRRHLRVAVPSPGNSTRHDSTGGEGSGGGVGGDATPSGYLIHSGEPKNKRRVALRGHSTIMGRSGEHMVPLSLDFYFHIKIQSCENAEAKDYRVKGDTWEFDRAWAEVNIQEFAFMVDNPTGDLLKSPETASYHLDLFRLFAGSTPLKAYPISFSDVENAISERLRFRKGREISMSKGTLTKVSDSDVERDSWVHASSITWDDLRTRVLAYDLYKRRGFNSMAETTARFRPGPVTIIDYRNVPSSSVEEKGILFAMGSFYSSLPENEVRSWLKSHFNRAAGDRKTHLHAELSHRFELELNLANIPVGLPKEVEVAQPSITEVDLSASALQVGHLQRSGREVSQQEMASTIPFHQSIGGTIFRKRTNCVRSIRERIMKSVDRFISHRYK